MAFFKRRQDKQQSEGNRPAAMEPEPAPPAADQPRRGLWGRLAERLQGTRQAIGGSIDRLALGRKIDEQVLEELEEVLVTADLGVQTSLRLIEDLRGRVRRKELGDAAALKAALKQGIGQVLAGAAPAPARDQRPHVIMVVGVNGVGKTTTIGKLAHRFRQEGRSVLLAAGDTFRAAAGEQLAVWAQRAGCDLVGGKHGADPSAVAYDALEAAIKRERDLLIIDTAGRLHTKVNLMEELKKIHRVLGKRLPGAPQEVLLVLDATTGQNALQQARLFHQAVPLTGLVLTKLDGTAKGGVVVAIADELRLPICFVGLGEGLEDLKPFSPDEFVEAIF
ncbi:MAG: signal recognition particle-docking protein FtsY [Desulfarculus sp.]|nr:MAG: signal recognition particle-docking protein FtsY [Desulfarculus sp.]